MEKLYFDAVARSLRILAIRSQVIDTNEVNSQIWNMAWSLRGMRPVELQRGTPNGKDKNSGG
jgi:hypothetical protein